MSAKLFTLDMFVGNQDGEWEAGLSLDQLANAVQVWAVMHHGQDVTVAEAARAFNTTADVVQKALEDWLYVGFSGPEGEPSLQFIWLDGE